MKEAKVTTNPFFSIQWNTPFELPRFAEIQAEHFAPAFARGFELQRLEINALAELRDPPTFENTIAEFERSGRLLRNVYLVFSNLAGAHTNEELQKVEREVSPLLAKHRASIYLNAGLFKRVDSLFQGRALLNLTAEQLRVLEFLHKNFVREGARLADSKRKRLVEISSRLATLMTDFSQNVLKEEADYSLVLEESDLAGLPAALVASAANMAAAKGQSGKYLFTLSRSHVEPFLKFSRRRDLRELLFKAWSKRGEGEGERGNLKIIPEIVSLRAERAKILGYNNFAEFKLDDTMAKTPAHVRQLLDQVWKAGLLRAESDRAELQALVEKEGESFAIEAHDWRFYIEKLRKQKFDLNEDELRSYFRLENVRDAAFAVANKLFGVTFTELKDVVLYHPDVQAFEVKDREGKHVAVFLVDYFARSSKSSGAWMSEFLTQNSMDGEVRPIITNVLNIAKPAEGRSALLSLEEARTVFHEFGHALHGMLSKVVYPSIAGTNVVSDFVELPSQLYEHWLLQKEMLREFARHETTGEPMPDELVDRVLAMRTFNQGFATVEFCASAYIDMDFHELPADSRVDVLEFEKSHLAAIQMPKEIIMRHRSPHFSHIFSSDGYAAGYYSYLWSEVLDADAFAAFEEKGNIFDPEVAERLEKCIYSAGGRQEAERAYIGFRGRLPTPEALMRKRGLDIAAVC